MNKIICKIEPGLGQQHIMFFNDDQLESQEAVSMDELINYLLNVCYTENCYNLHFIGNEPFIEGLVQEILIEENSEYNNHHIKIEVN